MLLIFTVFDVSSQFLSQKTVFFGSSAAILACSAVTVKIQRYQYTTVLTCF